MIPVETGKRYGRLVIIEDAGSKRVGKKGEPKRIVKAKCDCGTVCIKQFGLVRRGVVQSCGCIQREWVSQHALNRRKPSGESAFNSFYKSYFHGAKRRQHVFNLTKEEFRFLTQGNCAYCGIEPSSVFEPADSHGGYVHNGIDRVDNSQGYTVENAVPCCRMCNLAKGALTAAEFEAWIERLILFRSVKAA